MRALNNVEEKKAVFIVFNNTMSPRVQLLVKSLSNNGWVVSVIAWKRYEWSFLDKELLNDIEEISYISLNLRPGLWHKATSLPKLYKRISREVTKIGQVDLYFVTHLMLLPTARKLPGKVIYDSSEYYPIGLSEYFGFMAKFAEYFLYYIEKVLIKHVDGILAVDSANGWLCEHFKKSHDKVQVLWNLPSLKSDPPEDLTRTLRENFEGRKVIAYVGGLLPEKGLERITEIIIEVVGNHPEVLFIFIGPLRSEHKAIFQEIDKYGLLDKIKLLPPMPYREMMGHLMCADIGLALYQKTKRFAILGAGNSRKIFSYMQAGLAIIAPSFGVVGNVVKESSCGRVIDTEQIDEIVEAIRHYLKNDNLSGSAGAKGRCMFQSQYNWEFQEGKFLGFVKDVVE